MAFGLLIWLALSICVGCAADKRNRSFGGYFLLSVLLSPVIGFLVVIALGKKEE